MKKLWQSFLEHLWPSRSGPADDKSYRMVLLHSLIVLAIALAAGPEVFAAMEMTTLLELLGASLFLTAFGSALLLLAAEFARGLRNNLLPAPQLWLIRSRAPVREKAAACVFLGINATWWLMGTMVLYQLIKFAVRTIP